ncbi:class I SAM-dependent methyltransferase [Actinomadura latina]|uniref:S-adenosyl-L-methionine-dependent methyltransferase n=1 Tax=Actinomadura latina TaxID=163603 RepID=A0A846Z6X4_9ACTN|nr:class I SAM-dependent methyltransferase [Actinomadura latina]NKZ06504.1 class I SAM-dependent methyltransferase [Actinomadura latina]
MKSGRASRTAILVCQGRAVADGRMAVGRFSDPVAGRLLGPEELKPVDAARDGAATGQVGGRERWAVESVSACAEIVVPRTVVIDEAVTSALADRDGMQVVLLGAGLDTRPWRLPALEAVTVFSVDHPDTQADARTRAAGLTPVARQLVFAPVDLTIEPLDAALKAAGHDRTVPTVWVWEGVVPYLRKAEVAATATAVARLSAAGSVLVVNYQTPSLTAGLGRAVVNLASRLGRVETATADEPWRSAWTPARMARLLTAQGFAVERDVDLLHLAHRLDSPTRHSRSLRNGRVAVARFTGPAPASA